MLVTMLEKGDVMVGDTLLTRRAAELSPKYAAIANDGRRGVAERMEAAEAAMTMAVALAQPHRLGNAGKRAGDALATFCARLRRECYEAGETYCRKARAEKAARGFHVVDQHPGEAEAALTEEQIEAKREAAIMSFRESNGVLTAISPRLPRRMELLCYDRLPASPYDEDMLRHGLLSLARYYGILDEGINRDRQS